MHLLYDRLVGAIKSGDVTFDVSKLPLNTTIIMLGEGNRQSLDVDTVYSER